MRLVRRLAKVMKHCETGLTVAELPLGLLVLMPLRLASDQDLALRLVMFEGLTLTRTWLCAL